MVVKTRRGRSEGSREALLAVARQLFAERGYADTATEEIVRRAGLTRGALYHQFRDKEDLFRAVYQRIEDELTRSIAGRMQRPSHGSDAPSARSPAPRTTPLDEVRDGAQAFLDVSLDPAVQRIVFLDAPWVLGKSAGHQIGHFGLELIRRGLLRCMERRLIEPQPIEPLAHLLRAAITEAAMFIARAGDRATARIEAGAAVDRLIQGLALPEPRQPAPPPRRR